MKIFGCLIAALIGVAMACLMMQVVLYIGLSFGASYAARLLPGGLGTMVGDEIEAWVMGNPAQNVAEDGPMFDNDLIGTPPYSDTVPGREDCAEPRGNPAPGSVLTQGFHDGHSGIDLAQYRDAPIYTTQCGKVIFAGWNEQGYGNLVIVANGHYATYYAHLDSMLVGAGDEVEAGMEVGLMGNTGNTHGTCPTCDGTHLHYEVRVDGRPVDPAGYWGGE